MELEWLLQSCRWKPMVPWTRVEAWGDLGGGLG